MVRQLLIILNQSKVWIRLIVRSCLLVCLLSVMTAHALVRSGFSSQIGRYCRVFLYVLGIEVKQGSRIPDAINLIIANHLSYLDALVIMSLYPSSFLVKKEVKKWPVIGRLVRSAATIGVDRNDMQSRVAALYSIRKLTRSGQRVALFPEGTTSAETYPQPKNWQAGHILALPSSDLKIGCLGLRYTQRSAAWIGDDKFLPHLWQLLKCDCIEVYVEGKIYIRSREQARRQALGSYQTLNGAITETFHSRQLSVNNTLTFAKGLI